MFNSPSGPYCLFEIKIEPAYDDKEPRAEADYILIKAWDKNAKACNQYLRRDRCVLIEGRLKSSRNGNQRYTWVSARVVKFLDRPGWAEENRPNSGSNGQVIPLHRPQERTQPTKPPIELPQGIL